MLSHTIEVNLERQQTRVTVSSSKNTVILAPVGQLTPRLCGNLQHTSQFYMSTCYIKGNRINQIFCDHYKRRVMLMRIFF